MMLKEPDLSRSSGISMKDGEIRGRGFESRRVHTPVSVEEPFWGENTEIISSSNLTASL